MTKVLVIVVLVGLLLFFIVGRLFRFASGQSRSLEQSGFRQIAVDPAVLHHAIRSSVLTGLTGFVLLLVVLFLGMKIKILFILLPISLYLISQLFLIANHISSLRKVKVWYNPNSQDVRLQLEDGRVVDFNLFSDVEKVSRINAVQKNRKILMGIYTFSGPRFEFGLSCLLLESSGNKFFFDDIERFFKPRISTHLFPLV